LEKERHVTTEDDLELEMDSENLIQKRLDHTVVRSEAYSGKMDEITQEMQQVLDKRREENRKELEKRRELRKYLKNRMKSAVASNGALDKDKEDVIEEEKPVVAAPKVELSDEEDWEVPIDEIPVLDQEEDGEGRIDLNDVGLEVREMLSEVIKIIKNKI
jgi:hypothetical protein